MTDVVGMFETMASTGHAPQEGCGLFGIGYHESFERIRQKYFTQRFTRGGSGEKYVVGPFGSGKTHFLRQLMEVARNSQCATAEVQLNKAIDFANNLLVFQEVASQVRAPGDTGRGIRQLLRACLRLVGDRAAQAGAPPDDVVERWVVGLSDANFNLEVYGKVVRKACEAHLRNDLDAYEVACRWLSGEMSERTVARAVSTSPLSAAEHNVVAKRALLSLFQLIRHAGFAGTVIGYDEAEQGFSVDKKHMSRILSLLQSEINAVADLEKGSALIVYAVTPDLAERMETFPALQQRVADPGPGQGFFDGNTLAAKIDLTRRPDPEQELRDIGERLVNVFFDGVSDAPQALRKELVDKARDLGKAVAESEPSASSRRALVKRVCTLVIGEYDRATGKSHPIEPTPEPEV